MVIRRSYLDLELIQLGLIVATNFVMYCNKLGLVSSNAEPVITKLIF